MDKENKYFFLISLSAALTGFMIRLDTYIVNVSLPKIALDLRVGTGPVSLVILSYLLVLTSSMLLFGKFCDRFGLRRMFILGYSVFTAGSLCCAMSANITALILSRCLQGAGGAMLLASAFAIIPKYIPKEKVGRAFGLYTTAVALGITVGAPLGGIITGLLSWRWIFLINLPIGIAAIITSLKVIPEDKLPGSLSAGSAKFDILGAVISFMGFSSLVFSLNMGRELGWFSLPIISGFCAAFLLIYIFYLREKNTADPILSVGLLKNSSFILLVLSGMIGYLVTAGNSFTIPFLLEILKGLRTEYVGLVMLAYSVTFMLTAPLAGRISEKINPRKLGAAAMMLLAINFFAFQFTLGIPGLISVLVFLFFLGIFLGLFYPSNNSLAMEEAPDESRGAASGIYQTGANLGMIIGVALFETIFSQAIPFEDLSKPAHNITSQSGTILGFHNTYFAAAILCAVGFIAFILPRNRRQEHRY